eukprot:m.204656 g.204656  ORF g.204656 m.204656 type:complete len:540 (+) comp18473_c0_seq7:44-1663(+)
MWWPGFVDRLFLGAGVPADSVRPVMTGVTVIVVTTVCLLVRWLLRRKPASRTHPTVAIIGSGFAGIGMAIKLKLKGIPFIVYEKASDIGGTWRENRYPGCACDIPSHLYSFSFELNPDWSRGWSGQKEILAYLHSCCRKYGIYDFIKFETEVKRMTWVAEKHQWELILSSGEHVFWDVVVPAVGPLAYPRLPDIPGTDTFAGSSMHSAEWSEATNLKGKRVAVIGSAASSVQLTPIVAEQASKLYLFQRTPNWVTLPSRALIPAGSYPGWAKWLFRNAPGLVRLYRWYIYLTQESVFWLGIFDHDGGIGGKQAQRLVTQEMLQQVTKESVREVIIPEYPIGCKRILVTQRYLPALCRDNVDLIPHAAEAVTPTGVMSQGKVYDVDVIIYATGFQVGSVGRLVIQGVDGWTATGDLCSCEYPALYGIATRKCPNLFMLLGPASGLGHNSVVLMIEAQVAYICQILDTMSERGIKHVEVKESVLQNFASWVADEMKKRVWSTGCKSWYKSTDGNVYTLWPRSVTNFFWRTQRPVLDDFHCQ